MLSAVKKNIELETVAILASASPAERSRFEEFVLYGVASAGGLGLGLAIILLLVLRDDRFTSFAEINERLGENVVGQVPEVLGLKPRRLSRLVGGR
jgi:capsular polysaccharide biosynthesis protein